MSRDTKALAAADKRFSWHPFTQMGDWCAPDHEPVVLVEGEGAVVRDSEGREYVDGNASIWTNIHGHRHPAIVEALKDQLDRVAHTSFLGFTNPPAIHLAEELAGLFPDGRLTRSFFTDDGSTAMECAVKMAIQYWQLKGKPERSGFVSFSNAYHGDTMGAASLGGIDVFQERFAQFGFPVHRVSDIDGLLALSARAPGIAAVCIEPLIQGAAGMKLWPQGMLRGLRDWCDAHGVLLILDEVMTGFGRTGSMFACQREGVTPDFIALAKGLTGGFMPLAATLTSEDVFSAFLGRYEELKTFFYGHSYTGNPLGCAAALASLRVFREEKTLEVIQPKIRLLEDLLTRIRNDNPFVGETRQCGLIAGIDILRDPKSSTAFPWEDQTGARVCLAARKHGLLTRPVRDTLVLMPPLCVSADQLRKAVNALDRATREVCG